MKIEMNEEWRKKWVAALRSGEYKQAYRGLNIGDGFCCLGVLCDISGVGKWRKYEESDEYIYACKNSSSHEYLPTAVEIAVGLLSDETQKKLAELNDDLEYTFAQIADIIEGGEYTQEELGEDITRASEHSFNAVWDNPEDDEYDAVRGNE